MNVSAITSRIYRTVLKAIDIQMKPDTNFKDGLAIDDFKKSQMITALREVHIPRS